VRDKPSDDGPTPSGNSLAALAWERLSLLTEDARTRPTRRDHLSRLRGPTREPPRLPRRHAPGPRFRDGHPEGDRPCPPRRLRSRCLFPGGARPFLDVLKKAFVPNAALAVAPASDFAGALGAALPWAKDKPAKGGRATAYVCVQGTCKLPVTDPAEFAKILAETKPY
jgi:uncharacterized protein YyaL (SSP411 family)